MSDILVQKSINKARWLLRDSAIDRVEQIARRYDVPEIIARLLVQKGLDDSDVEAFIQPTLKKHFPDPFALKGMGDMAEDVAIAIEEKKRFAIFGDFDVDGATSSALLHRFLKSLGFDAQIYIPDRLEDGYGPNIVALRKLKGDGAEILFMLDCGTTAFDVVKAGSDIGLKIIILDHHETEDRLPTCWHVINPKRKDDSSGYDMLAAVGVTFLTCVAINNRLRDRGYYESSDSSEPDMRQFLDLVALGTVCDMVPLTGPNRLFARFGLAFPQDQMNLGLQLLIQVSGARAPLSTYDCGFILGPRINAGSRVHQSDLGAKLLSSDDPEECKNIAWTLNDCNDKRKTIQKTMEQQAFEMIESHGLENDPVIILDHEDWHPGLSGLVAGQVVQKYKKPACAITYATDLSGRKEGRGSGRSVPGVHIAQSFIDARAVGILEKGGGHAMAGGFTVLPEKLQVLKEFLKDHIYKQTENSESNVDICIDAILSAAGVTVDLVEGLNQHLGPFGQENPEPLFLMKDMRLQKADVLGESHIRVMISDWQGGTRFKGMAFKSVGTQLGDVLLNKDTHKIHLLGYLKVNEWQGRKSAEMHIVDAYRLQGDLVAA
ncbi:MAG: single-stranded-DNA-specific exonuclease RecJ [Alphaproteobacteria bacterium]|nr:single-stranded-DNA-specific exonuclease RecJ [Alphaproteobacteria bacterium]